MFTCALSPACLRIGSRPTLPERMMMTRPRCFWAFLRNQLKNSSVARLPSCVIASPSLLSNRFTRIGSSSIPIMTGLSHSAKAENISSPFRHWFPAAIPARSCTCNCGTDMVSTLSPISLSTFEKLERSRSHIPLTELDWAPISAIASAGSEASSRSINIVSNSSSFDKRRKDSLTKLVLPMRRGAVSNV